MLNYKTLLVIPAYNEAENLTRLINTIQEKCQNVDYVIINDCSTDNTLEILEQSRACYINLPINLGIGGAVQTGYRYAVSKGYDIAVQVDGDGQHDVSFLPQILAPIEEGTADIVIGSRFIKREGFQSTLARRIGISFLSGLISACTGTKIYDVTSGYRAVSGRYLKLFADYYPVDYPEPEAIVKASNWGACIKEVSVTMKARERGYSSIRGFFSVYYMIKVTLAIILCKLQGK